MNFELTDEQQLLADSLRRFLANDYTFDARAKIVASPEGLEPGGVGGPRRDGPARPALPGGARRLRRRRGGRDGRDGGHRRGAPRRALSRHRRAGRAVRPSRRLRGPAERRSCPPLAEGRCRWPSPTPRRERATTSRHVGAAGPARGRRLGAGRQEARRPPRRARRTRSSSPRAPRARTPTRRGISLFLVEREAPGVTVKEFRTIDELRAADITLRGVRCGARRAAGRRGRGAAPGRGGGRLRHRAPLRGGGGRHPLRERHHARVPQDAAAVRRADRQLPGAAAPHGGHGDQLRAGALDGLPRVRQGRHRGRRGAAARGVGGQGEARRRLPPRRARSRSSCTAAWG